MKLDSKYFDRIRLRPDPLASEKARAPDCAWEGCCAPGVHRAPRGRDQEGQYYHFCVDHVRLYNKSYNYFSGLNDTDIQRYLKDALTGHRPTWTMGASKAEGPMPAGGKARRWSARMPGSFRVFGDEKPAAEPRRRPRTLEAKALQTLDLPENAAGETIRMRYKALVKQYHPDANGGDRGSEDRLREVIQAYKLLKQSGFC